MKVLLIVNPQTAASQTLAIKIQEQLAKKQIDAALLSYTDRIPAHIEYDAAFSLGGDGTVLFAVRTVAAFGVPVLPLNLGSLGFIATIPPDDWEDEFERWRSGTSIISERIMLDVRVEREGQCVFSLAALNDAVISASGISKTIRLSAESGEFNLARYRSDGLIAATPTGSTAYCASAGGPVLDPEMEAVILNPVCPFSQLHRPLVTPARETITITVERDQRSGVLLTIDGQVTEALEKGDAIQIRKTPYKAKLIASGRAAFYRQLHSKLGMGGV
ncbi:MAG: NAD(+)/NADH kinase [Spirochaetaceae bacterium]|jgi:NAD+ kinase|nr:NAD(+)/NADH kinase [Spirochaetaceae bacterium]